jgi:heavy metal translocating P-type ATPase
VYGLVAEQGLEALVEAGRRRSVVGTRERVMRYQGPVEQVELGINGMWCSSCAWLIERGLETDEGVVAAEVSYATERAVVNYDPTVVGIPRLLQDVKAVGYSAESVAGDDPDFEEKHEDLVLRFGTALLLGMFVLGISLVLYMGSLANSPEQAAAAPGWIRLLLEGSLLTAESLTADLLRWLLWLQLALSTPIVFFAGAPILKGGLIALRHRSPNMDSLIAVGALTAWLYSLITLLRGGTHVYFDTAGMIITLILAGRLIELNAKRRSFRQIRRLLQLGAREARILDERGEEHTIPADRVEPGQVVIIRGGETVPVDGTVLEGSVDLDESLLTGESRPVPKSPGAVVVSGSLNLGGPLQVRADAVGGDTVLGGILRSVREAQGRKAPIQRLVDQVAALFMPFILLVAVGTVVGHYLAGVGLEVAIMHGVAVLVIACPCALGLATPQALLKGSARAAALGMVVRGGEALQRGASVDTVLFDKTGTLTEGRPAVVAFGTAPDSGTDADEVLRIAAALESHVNHPLGRAISEEAAARALDVPAASGIEEVTGAGVQGQIENSVALIGSARFLRDRGLGDEAVEQVMQRAADAAEDDGRTVVLVARDGAAIGWLELADRLRSEIPGVVAALRNQGMRTAIVSGDRTESVQAVAGAAGIVDALGGLTPDEKIREILTLQAAGYRVAMVGDGINDGPALAAADLGIAVGTGADLALETADVALLRSDLGGVPALIGLGAATMRRVRQNLFFAFLYNVAAIPLAVLGLLAPITAAAAMALSSATVTLNSVRQLRIRT